MADESRYTAREELLDDAKRYVTKERNKSYGEPDEDFQRIARIASAMGFRFGERMLTGADVALFMVALKLSRLTWNPQHRDSWTDIAGYAACGFETAELQEKRMGELDEQAPVEVGSVEEQIQRLVGHGWDNCAVCVRWYVSLTEKSDEPR